MDARALGSRAVLRRNPQLAPLTPAERSELSQTAVSRQVEERRARSVLTSYAIEGTPQDLYGRVLLLERRARSGKTEKRRKSGGNFQKPPENGQKRATESGPVSDR